jgi:hypothetical protein
MCSCFFYSLVIFSLLLERKCIVTVSTDVSMVSTDTGTISTHFGPFNHTETDTGSAFRRAGSTVCTHKSSILVPGHKGEEEDDEDGIDQLASAGDSAAALFPGNTGSYVIIVLYILLVAISTDGFFPLRIITLVGFMLYCKLYTTSSINILKTTK